MKLASEALAAAYRRCYGLPFAVIRFSNVYGRYDNDLPRLERAIWIFRRQILRGEPVTVFGEDKTLDFTYVEDAVDGLLRCLQRLVSRDAAVDGETFNLAYGEGRRLVDVVTLIAGALDRPAQMRLQPARAGEVTWYVAESGQGPPGPRVQPPRLGRGGDRPRHALGRLGRPRRQSSPP